MAQSKNNIITHGMSGMIGDMLVFRQRGGKTIVAKAPKDRGDKPDTAAQQAVKSRFQQAVLYGRAVVANAATKALYQAGAGEGQSAFNVAVADFYHAPDIEEVDLSGYSGVPGSVIRIRVTDDFAVNDVLVRIENADGSSVEEGEAILQPGTNGYVYTAIAPNASTTGDKIVITASDRAGNETTETKTL